MARRPVPAPAGRGVIQTEWPCISLTKTRGWEARDRSDDGIPDFAALVEWAAEQKLVSRADARVLRNEAEARPREAAVALSRVHDFRETSHALLSAVGSGTEVPASALTSLNRWAPRSHEGLELVSTLEGGFRRRWQTEAGDLDRILWACVRSLTDLLLAPELERLKFCNAHDCGWLFIDASRNRSRRWCDMGDCGNRAKVRRYRRRQRNEGTREE